METTHDVLDEVLPQYVEFVRLDTPEGVQRAVTSYMGDPEATAEQFQRFYGIDLANFSRFYIEVGLSDSPMGPLVAGRISPILVIRQSQSGQSYSPQILKCTGFYDMKQQLAWTEATQWDELVKDDLVEELKEQAAKERDRMRRMEKHMQRKMEENGD